MGGQCIVTKQVGVVNILDQRGGNAAPGKRVGWSATGKLIQDEVVRTKGSVSQKRKVR